MPQIHRFKYVRKIFATVALIFFFSFIFSHKSFSQNFVKEKTLKVKATSFSLDKLGNIYTVSEGNIHKYDAKGNLLFTFSNKGNGSIDFIDAANPLRILVYVKSFSIIYFFDNHLVLQSTLDLRQQLFTEAWPVCNSSSEGFWIYDRQNFLLLKLDGTLKTIAQSQPLNLTVADEIKPVLMHEGENYLAVLNDGIGFMIFDRLGSYFKTLRDSSTKNFTMSDDMLIYFTEEKLKVFNLKSGTENPHEFKVPSAASIGFFKNKVYILAGSEIEIYALEK